MSNTSDALNSASFNRMDLMVYNFFPPSPAFIIMFENPQKDILAKLIVDAFGNIVDFPGFENPQLINYYLEDVSDTPHIRFSAHIKKREDKFLFLWEIQPDGRFWEDEDGFGMGKGDETVLYSYLDDCGRFTSKFRIYRVGCTSFFDNDLEEELAADLKSGKSI